jgi:hypothetical protein
LQQQGVFWRCRGLLLTGSCKTFLYAPSPCSALQSALPCHGVVVRCIVPSVTSILSPS